MGPSPQRHLVMEHRASDWVKMQSKTLTAAAFHYNHVRIPLSRMFLFFPHIQIEYDILNKRYVCTQFP